MKKGTKHSEKAKGEMSLAKMDYIPWNKGLKGILGNHAKPHTKETKEKIAKSKIKHHIWYEDNGGNPTEKGTWIVEHGYHKQIHAVLKHNLWTDNRKYLAG